MFRNKIVVITGGAGGIGKCIADQFRNNGAEVCVIDTAEGDHYVGDIGSREVLEAFAETVIEKYGRVDVLVNNAPPAMIGIDNCSYEENGENPELVVYKKREGETSCRKSSTN